MAISVAVLAVAIPLAFAAMGEAARSGNEAARDNRSASILATCMDAADRARECAPGLLEACPPGMPFPPEGDIWALAFGADGMLAGRVTREQYDQGLHQLESEEVRYLAVLRATKRTTRKTADPLLDLTITIEDPAAQPSARRKKSTFHSSIR